MIRDPQTGRLFPRLAKRSEIKRCKCGAHTYVVRGR
jgi:hypothetical protein